MVIMIKTIILFLLFAAFNFPQVLNPVYAGGYISVAVPAPPQPPVGFLFMQTSGGKTMTASEDDTMCVKNGAYIDFEKFIKGKENEKDIIFDRFLLAVLCKQHKCSGYYILEIQI